MLRKCCESQYEKPMITSLFRSFIIYSQSVILTPSKKCYKLDEGKVTKRQIAKGFYCEKNVVKHFRYLQTDD